MNWCQIDSETYDMWEREWNPPRTKSWKQKKDTGKGKGKGKGGAGRTATATAAEVERAAKKRKKARMMRLSDDIDGCRGVGGTDPGVDQDMLGQGEDGETSQIMGVRIECTGSDHAESSRPIVRSSVVGAISNSPQYLQERWPERYAKSQSRNAEPDGTDPDRSYCSTGADEPNPKRTAISSSPPLSQCIVTTHPSPAPTTSQTSSRSGRLSLAQFSDSSELGVSESEAEIPISTPRIPKPVKASIKPTIQSLEPDLATPLDQDRFVSVTAELKSSQDDIQRLHSLLAERDGRLGELLQRIEEMQDEVEFVRDLLEWEKKKTSRLQEAVAEGNTKTEAHEKEAWQQILGREMNHPSNDTFPQEVNMVEDKLRKGEKRIEEMPQKLMQDGWKNHEMTEAASPSSSPLTTSPNSTKGVHPSMDNKKPTNLNESTPRLTPTTAATHSTPLATSSTLSDQVEAASKSSESTGVAPQVLGSFLLSEVAAWSSMSNLLRQDTSARNTFSAVHAHSEIAYGQKSSPLPEQMLRLCREREIFLFNVSGLFSSVYGPVVEGNRPSANPIIDACTRVSGAQNGSRSTSRHGEKKVVVAPIQADRSRGRHGQDSENDDPDDGVLEERIITVSAELEDLRKLRQKYLFGPSHRRRLASDLRNNSYYIDSFDKRRSHTELTVGDEDEDDLRIYDAISRRESRKRRFWEAFDYDSDDEHGPFVNPNRRSRSKRVNGDLSGSKTSTA